MYMGLQIHICCYGTLIIYFYMFDHILLRKKPKRRPGATPMCSNMYGDDDSPQPDGVRRKRAWNRMSRRVFENKPRSNNEELREGLRGCLSEDHRRE
ncbi:hypothetical protein Zmor_010051 [Zophobas morio]|uniref:Uncharacterized protein n=1 Tax=Zophobas morio TaxID=2755281 RepID=A0AA38II33_9CUCU|nr:hypothetical protein Zmor_010051 [Zophobas morio]